MTVLNIILLFINICIVSAAYFVFKSKFDSRYINKNVLDEVKKEINSLIVSLNETTMKNVTISENKIMRLKDLINQADTKISQVEDKLKNFERKEIKAKEHIIQKIDDDTPQKTSFTPYSPQNVLKSSAISNEINEVIKLKNTLENELVENQLEKMSITEKIKYLNDKGMNPEEIRKKLSLDPGEFEFLVNIENIQLKIK